MKLRIHFEGLFVLVATVMASCATLPDDPGPYPINYEEIIKSYLHATLKDPYSIQDLTINKPAPSSTFMGLLAGGTVSAYVTCVSYNAKNSFGAYVGISSYSFYIRNGAVLVNGIGVPMVHDGC